MKHRKMLIFFTAILERVYIYAFISKRTHILYVNEKQSLSENFPFFS